MHQHVGVTPTPRRPVSGTMAAGSLCPRWFMTAGASPLTSAFPQSAGHDLAPARRCALHLSTSSIRNTINENWAEDSVLGSRPGPPHQSFCCDNACCLPPPASRRAALLRPLLCVVVAQVRSLRAAGETSVVRHFDLFRHGKRASPMLYDYTPALLRRRLRRPEPSAGECDHS